MHAFKYYFVKGSEFEGERTKNLIIVIEKFRYK